jgi:putative DNA methylase
MTVKTRKKLIEVALPLEAINIASAREKSIRQGHPSTLHLWWARRPLAAARAVIFAQMVDDPSSFPDLFPTEKAQEKERARLFRIVEDLVKWENTTNETVLQKARDEIWTSWRRACAENADHPRAKELFERDKLPAFHDPFAGGGALPLEAQRLGLDSVATDLNPVAVLINKAMIEIPPKFAGRAPANPEARETKSLDPQPWRGAQGLAEDVRYYGQWMRTEAEKRIGHLYHKVEITPALTQDRPDLKKYVGRKLTVISWLWARTVPCPNPACNRDMPLLSSFVLSSKASQEWYLTPVISGNDIRFRVKDTPGTTAASAQKGYKRGESGIFECAYCGTVTTRNYVAEHAKTKGLPAIQTAVVVEGDRGRLYLPPEVSLLPEDIPAADTHDLDVPFALNPRETWCRNFGLLRPSDLFTRRQLIALTTFSDLVQKARERARGDAIASGQPDNLLALRDGGKGASAYADAVATYLACALEKTADYNSSLCSWIAGGQTMRNTFGRTAIPMVWDFAEANPISQTTGSFSSSCDQVVRVIRELPATLSGFSDQRDAQTQDISSDKVISTDPPYYDNIGYADLSDFFYAWLRRSLKQIFPDLFSTLAVPKAEELVAAAYRHGSKTSAEIFFLAGMTQAMHRLADQSHPAFPVTIYYAVRQSETKNAEGTVSTGWDVFLEAVIRAGFDVTGTWPMRTEMNNRMIGSGINALASSIVLVCRPRSADAPTATRREFVTALKAELPGALRHLQAGNVAPVDLAQAAIGPGMAVYTRYAMVLDALALINATLDEVLAEQEGDFDADSRWALAWFEQNGFAEGDYGVAETLSKAKNTSVAGMVEANILESKRGKVRLLKPEELPADWDPATDQRLTAWEIVHQLIRVLASGGEGAAAELAAKLGAKAELARELAYRLYTLCERKKRAAEALAYNGLVQSWPEIVRLAREGGPRGSAQAGLFEDMEG